MAKIVILGEHCRAELSEADEDGQYNYQAACGADAGDWAWQDMQDMISAAEQHVDACSISAPPAHHPDYE